MILPSYRKLPEHTGAEIESDIKQFWGWYHTRAHDDFKNLKTKATLDRDKRLMISGESAGGWLAVHSWMQSTKAHRPNVISLQYPMLDNYWRREYSAYLGQKVPRDVIEKFGSLWLDYINKLREDGQLATQSDSTPPEGLFWA